MQANTTNRTEYKEKKNTNCENSSFKPIKTKLKTDKSQVGQAFTGIFRLHDKTDVYFLAMYINMIPPKEMICSKFCPFYLAIFSFCLSPTVKSCFI